MKVILYSYFSQQNKRTNRFLLGSDSGVKLYSYIAKRLVEEGHTVGFVLPRLDQCEDEFYPPCRELRIPYSLAVSNLERRLQWHTDWLRSLDCDLLLTQHEFLSVPLRCLQPKLKIAMECGIKPDTAWPETAALFPLAWKSADLVHCNSEELARMVGGNSTVWQFAYEDSVAKARSLARDVDVLFNSRCSATGYSNHEKFLRAFADSDMRICITDPTSYLRQKGEYVEWAGERQLNRSEYVSLLHSSKVVVSLVDNGYGGYAFAEACAAGACPVCLRLPENVALLTADWPYYCTLENVREVAERAVSAGLSAVPARVLREYHKRLQLRSYSAAWRQAKADIGRLMQ